MRWTEDHDIVFLRELLLYEPYKHRKGSIERGKVWELIGDALNQMAEPNFRVTARSVRDHLKNLIDNYKRKVREEEKASGISPEESEIDVALADIIERFEVADTEHLNENNVKKAKIAMDAEKAGEMRKRSLETFSETKERGGDCMETPKRSRNNGSDTILYLREKSSQEMDHRKAALEQKQEETKVRREEQKQQQLMLNRISEQQNANLQMMQQQMQMQQQQQTALMKLMEKLISK